MASPDLHFIGLMSGTSVDAVDALVARFDDTGRPEIVATHNEPPPPALREALLALSDAGTTLTLADYGRLDQQVADWFSDAANAVRARADLAHRDIAAIGSHGQTVWHAPDDDRPFSLQIGSAARIAARTGCAVVSDFRSADLACGGQGAPLVCGLHAALFAGPARARAVVNIGGIANVTLLPAGADRDIMQVTGFDTGPGNGLMDAWIATCRDQSYDADGAWAASGRIDAALLAQLRADDYFARRPPKSTGREWFGLNWLQTHLARLAHTPAPADVQATLCELTAQSITDAVTHFGPQDIESIHLCGGGAHNRTLAARLAACLAPIRVTTTNELGVDGDWVEALAFAWLARQRLAGLTGNAPGVTGASGPAILGGWHLPPPARENDA
ncbi:anhydro-N-acetylmuramic acid kinase [Salinisphaera sp. Q1T1-3]|uniref:anhydro-N-acetylmuramic acid kinase n=1 Tax=Salinisphaera sp. Q1T1-3 TaxID=2321229 RepID=UPI000E7332B2|nr:anhydro-N-acetylmuramic acid kinase [Salinisphaera sp. Q1T1-3]RJS91575.1 anhydro-N-acetylmuramic acid kinase [Salinisphaera sp. Q1T1-3]